MKNIKKNLMSVLMFALIPGVVYLAFLTVRPAAFGKLSMLTMLITQSYINCIIAWGLSFSMTAGNLDLSIGAQISLATIVGKKIVVAYEEHCRTWELAVKAGVKIGMGTDFFPGPDNAMEMDFMVNTLGMDPMAVILAATKTGAEVLMRDDIGILDAGKLADIIVVDGDPLKNMALLRNADNVKIVMQGGKIMKQIS